MTMTTWAIFAMTDEKTCVGFRYHVGDITRDVQRQIVQSLRTDAKKNGDVLSYVITYPLGSEPTTHGHQRWLRSGYDLTLWQRGRGLSDVGWWPN